MLGWQTAHSGWRRWVDSHSLISFVPSVISSCCTLLPSDSLLHHHRLGTQVADFGMSAGNDSDEAASATTTSSAKAATWTGTYLYMAPVRIAESSAHERVIHFHTEPKWLRCAGSDGPECGAGLSVWYNRHRSQATAILNRGQRTVKTSRRLLRRHGCLLVRPHALRDVHTLSAVVRR